MKICIITCYKQPDYVRAQTLRAAAAALDDTTVIIVKNHRKGIGRYLEVLIHLLKVRLKQKPDVYLVTFRGYEILLPVRLLTIGRPLVYDEFIHPMEWLAFEHKKIKPNGIIMKLFGVFYWALIKSVRLVLTDTESHADLSARLTGVSRNKIASLPVGTDEATFKTKNKTPPKESEFTVLYYGNMLPLHGLGYVIEAAIKLKEIPVRFMLIGGSEETAKLVDNAIKAGANIDYRTWVKFDKLPGLMDAASICLAGPFGKTYQSEYVITGKAYQYLAMARPTIVGGNKESKIFTDKQNALIVPQADSEALAQTIKWAFDHSSELQAIGENGRELYDERFTTKKLTYRLSLILTTTGILKATSKTKK